NNADGKPNSYPGSSALIRGPLAVLSCPPSLLNSVPLGERVRVYRGFNLLRSQVRRRPPHCAHEVAGLPLGIALKRRPGVLYLLDSIFFECIHRGVELCPFVERRLSAGREERAILY